MPKLALTEKELEDAIRQTLSFRAMYTMVPSDVWDAFGMALATELVKDLQET